MVTGSTTYGYRLYHIWSQALPHMVTGSTTYGSIGERGLGLGRRGGAEDGRVQGEPRLGSGEQAVVEAVVRHEPHPMALGWLDDLCQA